MPIIQQDFWVDEPGEERYIALEEGEEVEVVGHRWGQLLVKGESGITYSVPTSYF